MGSSKLYSTSDIVKSMTLVVAKTLHERHGQD
jgi:hypothetical protein